MSYPKIEFPSEQAANKNARLIKNKVKIFFICSKFKNDYLVFSIVNIHHTFETLIILNNYLIFFKRSKSIGILSGS